MKIFNDLTLYREKVNFVDENNVFVGYDMGQVCCEHADFFFSREIPTIIDEGKLEIEKLDLSRFVFDTTFIQENQLVDLDEGGSVTFLLKSGEEKLYLTLFNCHNGYYGHGFVFKIGDEIQKEEYL